MSGTHGTEDGVSALTDIDRNNVDDGYEFYYEDCLQVGIKAGPRRTDQSLLSNFESPSHWRIGRDFLTSPSQQRS